MFCRNCGKEIIGQAAACGSCGLNPALGRKFCAACGAETSVQAAVCLKCGAQLSVGQKSRLAAGLLGIFLGGLGIHRFYLGFVGIGIAQIIVTMVTCGAGHLWGFVEGIMILTGNIDKDASGSPLKD